MTTTWVRLRQALVGIGVATLLLTVSLPSPASAASRDVLFATTSQSVRYGDSWGTDIAMTGLGCFTYCGGGTATFSYSGPRSGTGVLGVSGSSQNGLATSYLSSFSIDNGSTPLAPGKYVFSLYFSSYADAVSGSNTFTLTVTPAPFGTDLRVVSDPGNAGNAVVSVALTGDYTESIGGETAGPPLPAGTWHLEVEDADDKTAFSKDIPQAAGGPPFVSQYWTGVGTGPYLASASFEVDADLAARFTPTNAENVKFAPSASSSGATPVPTPSADPVSASTSSGAPAWVLLLGGLAILALITATVIRTRRRRPATSLAEGHADARR